MKNKHFFFYLILMLLVGATMLSSCKEDGASYSNCCDTVPLQASLDTGNIFIPNIITPNFDGANDEFYVQSDGGISAVNSLVIKNSKGNIVYEIENVSPNVPILGWNALNDKNKPVSGLFNYEITVTSALNQTVTFEGNICSYLCNADGFPESALGDCGFPVQHDGIGGWDANASTSDDGCF